MKLQLHLIQGLVALACLLTVSVATVRADVSSGTEVMTLRFNSVDYLHRWSKDGQNEFTPRGEEDLAKWQDMITVNVYETVTDGGQLAGIANKLLAIYQGHGKILRTDSRPGTADRPAEHLIVGILGDTGFLETVFTRFVLNDGIGYATVYSHRIYGKAAGEAMGDWLRAHGPQIENALMGWDQLPTLAALRELPQSR